MFQETFKTDHTLPPNKESLVLHCKRANYQTALWRQSLMPMITAPLPNTFGWICNADASLTIQWTEEPFESTSQGRPKTSCKCKRTRCTGNYCKCKKAKETCTPLFCKCIDCHNTTRVATDIECTENHDENENPSLDDNEERPPEYEEVDVPSDLDAVSESENESESGNECMSFDEIAVENFSEGENGYMSSDATEMYFSNNEN